MDAALVECESSRAGANVQARVPLEVYVEQVGITIVRNVGVEFRIRAHGPACARTMTQKRAPCYGDPEARDRKSHNQRQRKQTLRASHHHPVGSAKEILMPGRT